MITVTIGNNLKKARVPMDENVTLREALESQGIDYSVGMTTLDGSFIQAGGLNQTFAELGYGPESGKNSCFLLTVVKADNA